MHDRAAALAERIETLEERNAANARRAETLAAELNETQDALAAAEGQAGCVSHAAYYRLKDTCKKLGKPCVFVQSPGIGSFARSLTALTGSDAIFLSAARSAVSAG